MEWGEGNGGREWVRKGLVKGKAGGWGGGAKRKGNGKGMKKREREGEEAYET